MFATRMYRIRENFRLPHFKGFIHFKSLEHDFIVFRKCLSMSLLVTLLLCDFVCNKNFSGSLFQEPMSGISQNFKFN